ncbi:DUF6771 family protein [Sphingomonas faeni]|uniref:DUF6771 family protein n=1 Tax=Sphingomonas faeni TaxID=185950 RepID=UPI003364E58A
MQCFPSRKPKPGSLFGAICRRQAALVQSSIRPTTVANVITAEWIADLIERAPGWALVGLTVPHERMSCGRTTGSCRARI